VSLRPPALFIQAVRSAQENAVVVPGSGRGRAGDVRGRGGRVLEMCTPNGRQQVLFLFIRAMGMDASSSDAWMHVKARLEIGNCVCVCARARVRARTQVLGCTCESNTHRGIPLCKLPEVHHPRVDGLQQPLGDVGDLPLAASRFICLPVDLSLCFCLPACLSACLPVRVRPPVRVRAPACACQSRPFRRDTLSVCLSL
jgi:hypothetical protein